MTSIDLNFLHLSVNSIQLQLRAKYFFLTLMRVGSLGVCFGMGVGWGKITSPCLKLVRVMLET